MKTGNGFEQCYNAQASVDESGVIVATEVTNEGNDTHQWVPMVKATQNNVGILPQMTTADSGYLSEANFMALEALQVQCAGAGPGQWGMEPGLSGIEPRRPYRLGWMAA